MKKILQNIIITILCLIVPVAIVFIPIGNNIILSKYTKDLKNFKLNADYQIVATDSDCGKLEGNGNGMQYFSVLLIHSNDDLVWENNDIEGVFLVKVNEAYSDDLLSDLGFDGDFHNISKKLTKISNTKNYYILYSFYCAPLDSIWNDDLRAH